MEIVDSGMGLMSYGLQQKPNYLFTNKSIKILKSTDFHIVYEWIRYDGSVGQDILDCRYCDNNWVDYDELINTNNEYQRQQDIIKKQIEIGSIFVKYTKV